MATVKRPLLIFLDSVDELTGSQVLSVLFFLNLNLSLGCKQNVLASVADSSPLQGENKKSGILGNEIKSQIVVSCTYEEGKPALMQVLENSHFRLQKYFQDLNFLRQMVEDDNQFLEVEKRKSIKI